MRTPEIRKGLWKTITHKTLTGLILKWCITKRDLVAGCKEYQQNMVGSGVVAVVLDKCSPIIKWILLKESIIILGQIQPCFQIWIDSNLNKLPDRLHLIKSSTGPRRNNLTTVGKCLNLKSKRRAQVQAYINLVNQAQWAQVLSFVINSQVSLFDVTTQQLKRW
jgi:hypothetical protein